MKRTLDFLASLAGLVVLSPLFITIALWIKRDSEGSVFYGGVRAGKGGKPFKMLKFRTMVVDADKIGGSSTAADDSRLTIVGKRLRKYKLDELPQLINVLRGEMSLVGPRPEVQQYIDMYTEEEKVILELRPGITDWASLWDSDEGATLANSDDPDRAYLELIRPTKIRLQLYYVRERSLGMDLRILLLTILNIFRKEIAPRELLFVLTPREECSSSG